MITYQINTPIDTLAYSNLLKQGHCSSASTNLASPYLIKAMLDNTSLLISAWRDSDAEPQLIGVARCITDFTVCCYIAELVIDAKENRADMAKTMLKKIEQQLPPHCELIILQSPSDEKNKQNEHTLGFTIQRTAWLKTIE